MTTFGPLPTDSDSLVPVASRDGPPAMHCIARMAGRDGRPGWEVAVHRGGRRLRQRFADHNLGGPDPALAVACAWRDAVLRFVPALGAGHGPASRKRARTGTLGLYRLAARPNRAASWQARVVPPGGGPPRTRSFSTAGHGEDAARALAEAWLTAELAPAETQAAPDATPAMAPSPPDAGEAGYGISRVVGPTGRAIWHVGVIRAALHVQAGFPDLTYGGEAPALAVARAWRDAVMAAVPPLTNIELRQVVRARRPGTPGVYRDAGRQAWRAVVTLPGPRSVARYFKVAVHGKEGARALAEAERLHMLDELRNGRDPALRSPVARDAAKRDFRRGRKPASTEAQG